MEAPAPISKDYYFQDRPPEGPTYHLVRTGQALELFRDGEPIKKTFDPAFVSENAKCFQPRVREVLEYLLQRAQKSVAKNEFSNDPRFENFTYADVNGYIGKIRTLLCDGDPPRILINSAPNYIKFDLVVTDHPPVVPKTVVPIASIPHQFDRHKRPPALPKLDARNNMVRLGSLKDHFIGRTASLWAVHDAIAASRLAVVTGTGGVGKTQLAVEYIWRFGNYFPGGVFWVEGGLGRTKMVDRIARTAGIDIGRNLETAGGSDADRELADEQERVESLWAKLAGPPVLIAVNNLPEGAFPRSWFPAEPSISVLITTRRRGVAPANEVYLDLFTPEESLALLNSGTSDARKFTESEAGPLIEELGGLPLALELARGNLQCQQNLPTSSLVDQIRSLDFRTLSETLAATYMNELPSSNKTSILATFQLSWNLAREEAKIVLQAMSELSPDPVPLFLLGKLDAFSGPSGKDRLEVATSQLCNLSLVKRLDNDAIQAHRLLLRFICETDPAPSAVAEQIASAICVELEHAWNPRKGYSRAVDLSSITPHAEALIDPRRLPATAYRLARGLMQRENQLHNYRGEIKWAERVLEIAEEVHSANPREIACAHIRLGWALKRASDPRRAEIALRQGYTYLSRSHGSAPDINLACSQRYLGATLTELGQHGEAESLLRDAVASFSQIVNSEAASNVPHESIEGAFAEQDLGVCLQNQGRPTDAYPHFMRACESLRSYYQDQHPELIDSERHLAFCLLDMERISEAHSLFKKCLEEWSRMNPADHTMTASLCLGLARTHECLLDTESAVEYYAKSAAIYSKIFAPSHSFPLGAQVRLAEALLDGGRIAEAAPIIQASLDAWKQRHVRDGWDFTIRTIQGRVPMRLGEYFQAKTIFAELLPPGEGPASGESPQITLIRMRLGMCLLKLNDEDHGLNLVRPAQDEINRTLDPECLWMKQLRDDASVLFSTPYSPRRADL